MNSSYHIKLKKHFLYCKKLLNLPRGWKINITVDNTITEYANVVWNYPAKIFSISINETANQQDNDLIDSITHELLHILLSPTSTKIERVLSKIKAKKWVSVVNTQKQFDKLEENLVCHLTKVIIESTKGAK